MKFIHMVSVSSGKDSTATMLMAIDRRGKENCRFVFADTGNEDAAVEEYLQYLERTLDITIVRLKASFDDQIANKRMFIARDRRVKKRRVKKRDDTGRVTGYTVQHVRWSNKAKRRALAVLHPTGNPFLDLCLWKGRFPARKSQFCTQHLKTELLVEYQMSLMDKGFGVISWQGVRRDESANRAKAKLMQRTGPRLWAFRPIIHWTAQQTVDYVRDHGLRLNPLYSQGFNRVGCMPCINCRKEEVRNIDIRRPAEIERIRHWERLVGQASKRGESSFFPNPSREDHLNKRGIDAIVQWSRTTRGGKQIDLLPDVEPTQCSSSYGLCE